MYCVITKSPSVVFSHYTEVSEVVVLYVAGARKVKERKIERGYERNKQIIGLLSANRELDC